MRLYTQAYKSHTSQYCGVKPIHTHCKTVAVMVLILVSSVGMKSAERFSVNPKVVHRVSYRILSWGVGENRTVAG